MKLTDSRHRTSQAKQIAQRVTNQHWPSHGRRIIAPTQVEHQQEECIDHNERDADSQRPVWMVSLSQIFWRAHT